MLAMRGHRRSTAAALIALSAAAFASSGCGSGHSGPAAATRTTVASSTSTSADTTTTSLPVTTTTVDPGSLPQTAQLPSASDPLFVGHMSDLLQAVMTGDVTLGAPAFFPLGAYIQVKGISDPAHDYRTRLIADYDQDIAALHSQLAPGTAVTYDRVSVPATAEWIRPGVEYNKGSYWRVYGSRLWYTVGGQVHSFPIASMISWRGEWYVVHLSSIR